MGLVLEVVWSLYQSSRKKRGCNSQLSGEIWRWIDGCQAPPVFPPRHVILSLRPLRHNQPSLHLGFGGWRRHNEGSPTTWEGAGGANANFGLKVDTWGLANGKATRGLGNTLQCWTMLQQSTPDTATFGVESHMEKITGSCFSFKCYRALGCACENHM